MVDAAIPDVLQIIEFAIVEAYHADRALVDTDAREAIDALLRYYRAVADKLSPPDLSLSKTGVRVFDTVHTMCEWRLGNIPFPRTDQKIDGIPVSDLVACLRKIQKSITRWSGHGGRQAYLKFVSQYLM